jgi:signal transduction histidine kinase
VLSGGAVLTTVLATTAVTAVQDRLDTGALTALGIGAVAGLLVTAVVIVAARRLAAALSVLHSDAVLRLHDPSSPVVRPGRRPAAARMSTELTELSRVLDALHLRVRVADEVGARHQRDAQTVGAGVHELLSGLVAAEEGARGQLSAELHDTVAQSLALARGLLRDDPASPATLAALADHLEDAEEQVRAVMARTRPPALRDGDLASAVSGLRADMAARYGLDVHVSWPEAPHPLPLAAAVTLYRFFQEALLNVVKHADVDEAELALAVEQGAVVGIVRDAGPGFDPGAVRPVRGRHVGLGLLRERARLSGGVLHVLSGTGEGTVLTLRLPRPTDGGPEQPAGLDEHRVTATPG